MKVMPLFVTIGHKWSNDELIAESLCDCVKKALTTLLDDIKPLVEDILQLLLYIYSSFPQISVLEISKQIMLLFNRDLQLESSLMNYYVALSNHTMNACKQNMRQQTTLIESYFSISTNLIKKMPAIYRYNLLDVSTIFECALSALTLPEKPTVRYCSSFISEFINQSRENEAMFKVVNNNMENIIAQIFNVICGTFDSPRCVVEHMSDVLMALNQKYYDSLCRNMNEIVQKEGAPSPKVNRQQKEQFIRSMLREKKNKRKLKEIINEFSLTCRGLINTEYGNQLIKLPF